MITKLQNPVVAASLGIALSIGVGVGASWKAITTTIEHAVVAAAEPKKDVAELKQKGWDFWTIEIENLSNELKEEKVRLQKQAELLDQRAARLAAEEKEFAKLRADVEGLRKQIAEKVVEIAADESKNLRSLAQTYTNLSPRAAVAIFKEMDDNTAVKILSLMKADIVGPIFEEMSKTAAGAAATDGSLAKRAAVLSEKLRMMKASKSGTS
jgi:flagellar motility protein MotE (MotC chaperone)